MGTETEVKTEVKDGNQADTSSATAQATETKKPETDEGGEDKKPEEKKPDLEKKYTDSDVAEIRRRGERETRKERDARIRAEERAKVYEEIHGGKKQPDTPPAEDFTPTRPRPQRPNKAEFETTAEADAAEEKWIEDLADWKSEQREVKREQTTKKTEALKPVEEFQKKGAEKYEGFAEALKEVPSFTHAMADACLNAENGIDVAHYLTEHHDEAVRIGKLSLSGQVREMDKLVEKLKTPPTKTKETPPPPASLDGKGSTGSTNEEKAYTDPNTSTDERIRISQERKRREAQGK